MHQRAQDEFDGARNTTLSMYDVNEDRQRLSEVVSVVHSDESVIEVDKVGIEGELDERPDLWTWRPQLEDVLHGVDESQQREKHEWRCNAAARRGIRAASASDGEGMCSGSTRRIAIETGCEGICESWRDDDACTSSAATAAVQWSGSAQLGSIMSRFPGSSQGLTTQRAMQYTASRPVQIPLRPCEGDMSEARKSGR